MDEEKMILSHEPIPLYRKVFHVTILVAVVILAVMFMISVPRFH
jgi:hypothetical protein